MNRRILGVIMLLTILVFMTACGNTQEEPTVTTVATDSTTTPTETVVETTEPRETIPNVDYVLPEGENVEEEDVTDTEHSVEETKNQESNTGISETKPAEQSPNTPSETIAPTEAPASTSCGCEYEAYLAMSPADQEAYMNSFASPMDFITWSRAAEAEHAGHNTVTNVTGGDLDIGDFID